MPGAYIFGLGGTDLTEDERGFFREADPWGFILFSRNMRSPEQVRALTAALREAVGRDAPILVDQEGGRVQRMGEPHWRDYLPALDQMRLAGDQALRAMEIRSQLIAAELISVGIDVNCAPLADLVEPRTTRILRNRLYGSEPEMVVAACRAVIGGMAGQGVLPVLKHIPGYGRAAPDPHLAVARLSEPLDDLRARDFAPFAALSDVPMGMTAHIVIEAVDPVRPATVSPAAMSLIRRDAADGGIGYDGLVMTDDISMQALSGSVSERSDMALAAGCDVVLHCNGDMADMEGIVGLGAMSDDAMRRAARALSFRRSPEALDEDALWDELQGLQ